VALEQLPVLYVGRTGSSVHHEVRRVAGDPAGVEDQEPVVRLSRPPTHREKKKRDEWGTHLSEWCDYWATRPEYFFIPRKGGPAHYSAASLFNLKRRPPQTDGGWVELE